VASKVAPKVCPTCGACPTCGRHAPAPFVPQPATFVPWVQPTPLVPGTGTGNWQPYAPSTWC